MVDLQRWASVLRHTHRCWTARRECTGSSRCTAMDRFNDSRCGFTWAYMADTTQWEPVLREDSSEAGDRDGAASDMA